MVEAKVEVEVEVERGSLMVTKQKGKMLKDKEIEGDILKDETDGDLIKDKKLEGDPLWKNKENINEDEYKDKNLNESV